MDRWPNCYENPEWCKWWGVDDPYADDGEYEQPDETDYGPTDESQMVTSRNREERSALP